MQRAKSLCGSNSAPRSGTCAKPLCRHNARPMGTVCNCAQCIDTGTLSADILLRTKSVHVSHNDAEASGRLTLNLAIGRQARPRPRQRTTGACIHRIHGRRRRMVGTTPLGTNGAVQATCGMSVSRHVSIGKHAVSAGMRQSAGNALSRLTWVIDGCNEGRSLNHLRH